MNASRSDVLILGGGVIGLACALYLLKAGVGVRVLEQGTPGCGSSHGNCGTITPSHAPPLAMPGMIGVALRSMLTADAPLYLNPRFDGPRLRWLLLTDTAIEVLPDALGACRNLQKLMLAGNRLAALPDLSACRKLELLRLSANRFTALPETLSVLPRLTWLAFAGNPFTQAHEAAAHATARLPHIDWTDLDLGERLGEGASGHIRAARRISLNQPAAVKIFKGEVTSDGLPRSELSAALAAGRHEGLIPLLGRAQTPEGRDALIMQRLPPSFRPLAAPPDFDTCTRDVYAQDQRFTAAQARNIAADIASVLSHLHESGLIHGDLYAHNILFDGESALITDFGAASPLPPDAGQRRFLQSLDLRAYGILLQELADRCDDDATAKALRDLAAW